VVNALLESHPYEEVAYDIYPIENAHPQIGLGVIGETKEPVLLSEFLKKTKETFACEAIKYTETEKTTISKVALCGGAGFSLLRDAMAANADIFLTGDVKYHQFFEGEGRIVIADIGHYESEQFTKELFSEILTKKFSKFALRLSKVQTNPVKYYF
jgi:putative NIF3 family GTP cyclohydrolase 1 type 2